MKCIKSRKCRFYFESDGMEKCNLADKIIKEKCIGFKLFRDKEEDIICKISRLQQELECLKELPLIIGEVNNS